MTSFYSPTTGGLYQSETYEDDAPTVGLVPSDSILIEDELHDLLVSGLSAGNSIVVTDGLPASTPPTVAQLVATAQKVQVALLQATYQSEINAPVTFKNAAGVTSTYSAGNVVALNGQTAKQNVEDSLAVGAAGWTMGLWLDTNNVAQVFTYADLQGLSDAMGAVVQTDWKILVQKIAAVQAAATVADVQSIT
jgi:hypothetical protein